MDELKIKFDESRKGTIKAGTSNNHLRAFKAPFLSQHKRQQSRKFTLSGAVDATTFWHFYFGQQSSVTFGQLEGAIVSILESLNDSKRTAKDQVESIMWACAGQSNSASEKTPMVKKSNFYQLLEKLVPGDVAKSFVMLQDEYSQIQILDSSKKDGWKELNPNNFEKYLAYADKYAHLLRHKNLSKKMWMYVLNHFFVTKLGQIMDIAQRVEREIDSKLGIDMLKSDIFSNARRMKQFLSDSKSCFLKLTEDQLIQIARMDHLAVSEELFFDRIIEWARYQYSQAMQHRGKTASQSAFAASLAAQQVISPSRAAAAAAAVASSGSNEWHNHLKGILSHIRIMGMSDAYLIENILPLRSVITEITSDSDQLLWIFAYRLSIHGTESRRMARQQSRRRTSQIQSKSDSLLNENEDPSTSDLKSRIKFNLKKRLNAPKLIDTRSGSNGSSVARNDAHIARLEAQNKALRKKHNKVAKQASDLKERLQASQENESRLKKKLKKTSSKQVVLESQSPFTQAIDSLAYDDDISGGEDDLKDASHRSHNDTVVELGDDSVIIHGSERGDTARGDIIPHMDSHRDGKKPDGIDDDEGDSSDTLDKTEYEDDDNEDEAGDNEPSEKNRAGNGKNLSSSSSDAKRRKPGLGHKLSIASDIVDSIEEGNKTAGFLVKFSRLDGQNDEEKEMARQRLELMRERMNNRRTDDPSSTTENESDVIRRSGTSSVSTTKKKKKKKYVKVENLELPLWENFMNPAEEKWMAREAKQISLMKIKVGSRVTFRKRDSNQIAVVKYIGEARFIWGYVIGCEFEKSQKGLNNGIVQGVKYFECRKNKGIIVKPHCIEKVLPVVSKGSKKKSKKGKRASVVKEVTYSDFEKVWAYEFGTGKERQWDGKFGSSSEKKRHQRLNIMKGDVVVLNKGERGIVHFIGSTCLSKGQIRFGIELLDGALGTGDGEVNGERYFECEENRGDFVSTDRIRKKVDFITDFNEW